MALEISRIPTIQKLRHVAVRKSTTKVWNLGATILYLGTKAG